MIAQNLAKIRRRIDGVKHSQQVTLVAVGKTKSAADLQQAIDAGQRHFGENYLQEALEKIEILKNQALVWHFIGAIQSNKTKAIAQNFDWVHSVDQLKIAQRLNHQRPLGLKKLNVLLQVNIDHEATKSGVLVEDIEALVPQFEQFQHIVLRGFMCIPHPNQAEQSFKAMSNILKKYPNLDTLSMGMSADFDLAVKNGATFVRVGTDIFGQRVYS